MNLVNNLIHGDCFKVFPFIEDHSIDLILTDPPYNMTDAGYDCPIDLGQMWIEFNRIIKENGIIAITSSQPFTTDLIYTNKKYFRYEWIWKKSNPSNFVNAKYQPLKYHENVCIFYKKSGIYNPQMIKRESNRIGQAFQLNNKHSTQNYGTELLATKKFYNIDLRKYDPNLKQPSTILEIPIVVSTSKEKLKHPAQKPVSLFEYFIKTYTEPNMVVLDAFAGTCTIIEACLNTKRNYIAIELDEKYIQMGLNRLKIILDRGITIQSQTQPFGVSYSFLKPIESIIQRELNKKAKN